MYNKRDDGSPSGVGNGDIALRNLNETTRKYKRWVDRWYYNSGVLTCRVCEASIVDVRDVCLYNGKVMHVECMERKAFIKHRQG